MPEVPFEPIELQAAATHQARALTMLRAMTELAHLRGAFVDPEEAGVAIKAARRRIPAYSQHRRGSGRHGPPHAPPSRLRRACSRRRQWRRRRADPCGARFRTHAARKNDVKLTGRAILSMLNWMARWYQPGKGRRATSWLRTSANSSLAVLGSELQRRRYR